MYSLNDGKLFVANKINLNHFKTTFLKFVGSLHFKLKFTIIIWLMCAQSAFFYDNYESRKLLFKTESLANILFELTRRIVE